MVLSRRGSLLARAAIFVLLLAAGRMVGAQVLAPSEYEAKAAFVYNFTKFVEWPAGAFADAAAPLLVCVLGDDPFGSHLDGIAERQAQGRNIELRHLRSVDPAHACHILFLAASEQRRLATLLAALRQRPILTIGDSPGFAEQGVAVNLVFADQRVRMEINNEAAQRAGLKISSRVLRLATIVRGGQ